MKGCILTCTCSKLYPITRNYSDFIVIVQPSKRCI